MEVAGWFIGAGIGTVFTALYEGIKEVMGRTTKFKAQLEALKLTLESFDPEVIQQIGKHNQALRLPNEDVEALEQELNNGVRIVGELADAHRIDSRYVNQLVHLNKSLNVLERRVKMQSVRVVMETRHIVEILLRLTLQPEPGRDGRLLTLDPVSDIASTSTVLQQIHSNGEIHASYSTVLQQIPTRRLLDISSAPQEAIHHMLLNFDPLSNIEASTSTVLPQIHSNGDIQEVGSSSRRLPSPLGYSNYEGSDDQPQINCEQLATTSSNGPYFKVRKIVLRLAIHGDKCKSKALKVAASIDGVVKNGCCEYGGNWCQSQTGPEPEFDIFGVLHKFMKKNIYWNSKHI